MAERYILALDQGTSSSRALLFDRNGKVLHQAQQALASHFPQPGWVEQDPADLWQSQIKAARQVMREAGVSAAQTAAIGLTNQRETTLIWDRRSGEPVAPAIVWQCRRSAGLVEELHAQGYEADIRQRTGLVLDAYFSATKIRWLLDHVPGARQRASQGYLAFGTVDTWLLYQLSGGRLHCTDASNASRTMLYNIHTCEWDEDILSALDIPASLLPEVRDSSGDFGTTTPACFDGTGAVPIGGVIGDQQGALFGQACFTPGMVKNTYGTGSFVLMHNGDSPGSAHKGLLTTVAWRIGGLTSYALEGSIFMTGATMQWLRDELQIIENRGESERCSQRGAQAYLVASPAWAHRMGSMRRLLVDLTRHEQKRTRPGLERMAYQTRDVIDRMAAAAGTSVSILRVDGGAAGNDVAMQFQSDILQIPVQRPQMVETTAWGAAGLAGLAVGFWQDQDELAACRLTEREFTPCMPAGRCGALYGGWQEAVRRAAGWTTAIPGQAEVRETQDAPTG